MKATEFPGGFYRRWWKKIGIPQTGEIYPVSSVLNTAVNRHRVPVRREIFFSGISWYMSFGGTRKQQTSRIRSTSIEKNINFI